MPRFILTNLYSYCIASYLINNLSLFVQLTAVHFVDAHRCCDPGKYVIALPLSLSTMLHLELPHINVLCKIDVIESYGKLRGVASVIHWKLILIVQGKLKLACADYLAVFNLHFYTVVQDRSYLQFHLGQDRTGLIHCEALMILLEESVSHAYQTMTCS